MQVKTVTNWLPRQVDSEIRQVHRQLQGFHGYRTVWLEASGALCHAEPEEELEREGLRYVGTFMRPHLDELSVAVALVLPVRSEALRAPARTLGLGRLAIA